VVRDDASSVGIRRLMDFLGLPRTVKDLIPEENLGDSMKALVWSNTHRVAALYPPEAVGPVVNEIVASGFTVIMTWADAVPAGAKTFETILNVRGNEPKEWERATLRVEKGPSTGALRTGPEYRLGEIHPLAAVLARDFR
jgi:hypothetical protein